MNFVALRMLTGDRAKYFGLVFAIAFCTFLLENQTSIFANIMKRTASQVLDVTDADVWVMDPQTEYWEQTKALKDTDLTRVRGVAGVQWAVRLFKGNPVARTLEGKFASSFLIGIDDATLAGAPREMLLGSIIAGLLDRTEGELSVLGTNVDTHSSNERVLFRRRNLGFIFQQFNLLPALTAAENVAVPLIAAGVPRRAAVDRARGLLSELGLGTRLTALPATLSGRQEQAARQYEKAVLVAVEEVEDALSAHTREERRLEAFGAAVAANRRALNLATERYTGGLEDFLSVLDAERAVYATEDAQAESETTAMVSLIAVYKALGGGWTPDATASGGSR